MEISVRLGRGDKKKGRFISFEIKRPGVEVPSGFEPLYKVLQTSA